MGTPRAFNAEQDALIASLYRDGWSAPQIADRMKCNKSTILAALKRVGEPRREPQAGRVAARASGYQQYRKDNRPAYVSLTNAWRNRDRNHSV
jgi:IS30 family transposase